jgi:hypothetical protein
MAGYAEVIVQYNETRSFSNIFASGPIPVKARAVARVFNSNVTNGGIIALNPTVDRAFNVSGPGNVNVKSGTIIVDSNNSQAAVLTGAGSTFTSEVDITGDNPGWSRSGQGTFITSPTTSNIITGQNPTPDPYLNLPVPDPMSMPVQSFNNLNLTKDTVLQPGRYIGGISISGGKITMMPGIYYMDQGGFTVSNGNVTGAGVMIYNNCVAGSGQKVTISGGDFNLSAPTAGVYQGMVIFQQRNAGDVPIAITGPGTSTMLGAVYAHSSPVDVSGSGGATISSQLVADTITVTGAGDFNVDWKGQAPPQTRKVQLVE